MNDVGSRSDTARARGAQSHGHWRLGDERDGWKRPRGEREAPHPFFVDYDRHRVICRECPWFWERLGATYLTLKAAGQRHRSSMRESVEARG